MAKGKYKITKSIGILLDTVKELDWLSDPDNPQRKFKSLSDAVTSIIDVGLFVFRQEGRIDSGELIEKMNGVIKDEKMMEFLQQLSPSQRQGLKQMIGLVEERGQKTLL